MENVAINVLNFEGFLCPEKNWYGVEGLNELSSLVLVGGIA